MLTTFLPPVWGPGQHIEGYDFSPIEKALSLPGFDDDLDAGTVTVGFARNAVLSVAPTIIEAVKGGAIKHFFLVGGCDGIKNERGYYTEFVEQTPPDTVILTLACGKFRFFDKQLGDIGGSHACWMLVNVMMPILLCKLRWL